MKRTLPSNPTTPWPSISSSSSPQSSRSSSASSLTIQQINNNRINTTAPSTTIKPSNNDLFSYNLGLSLKRVKISSTTPGELRLMKDIDLLITQYHFKKTSQQQEGQRNDNNNRYDIISLDNTIRIDRDPVDALRLRVCITVRNTNDNIDTSSAPKRTKTWIFLIKIPRMYPHTPPIIYRISYQYDYALSPSSLSSVPPPSPMAMEDDDDVDTRQRQLQVFPSSTSTSTNNTSIITQMSIIISNTRPYHHLNNSNKKEEIININTNTTYNNKHNNIAYYGWTPISTLWDLFIFLSKIAIPTIENLDDNTDLCMNFKQEKYNILFPLDRFNIGYNNITTSASASSNKNKRKNNIISMDLE